MNNEIETAEIEDPIAFFASLGNLRGAGLDSISVEIADQILYLVVDDLHAHLEESPDYPGQRPCALIFLTIGNFRVDADLSDGLRIGALRILETPDGQSPYRLEVDLDIGGAGRPTSISASFSALEIEELDDEIEDFDDEAEDDDDE
ncbi:MAG TPA: hypothetical protein VN229_23450 [Terriglobales bacterium]|nr:hypothetical protein [Terriglobales bacterium]